ncbi:MAG: hypothetical protein QXU67_03230 [Candidatus Bathyarchaeia archaeon]
MSPINEYIITALIIVSIIVASTTMVTSAVTPLRTVFERERLKMTAEKLLTQILLSTGEPSNWGSEVSLSPKVFGLAAQMETTREAYTLDIDKLGRIADESLNNFQSGLYISPQKVLDLLNLKNEYADYGFSLEIFPFFNIEITWMVGGEVTVNVSVTNPQGQPVANAKVLARLYWTDLAPPYINTIDPNPKVQSTKPDGSCTFGFGNIQNILNLDTAVIVVYVEQFGTKNFKLAPIGIGTGTRILQPNGLGKYTKFWNPIPEDQSLYNVTGDDSDETYIYTQQDDKKVTMAFDDIEKLPIQSVTAYARCKSLNSEGESIVIIWSDTKNEEEGNTFNLSNDWMNCEETREKNPLTKLAWTWQDINNLQIGVKVKSKLQQKEQVLCSKLWIEVKYGGMTVPAYFFGKDLFIKGDLTPVDPTIRGVLPIIREDEISFREVNFSLSSSGSSYNTIIEPSAIALIGAFRKDSIPHNVFVSRTVELRGPKAYKTISTYPELGKEFPLSAFAERVVKIQGCTYIARLYVWRMSY